MDDDFIVACVSEIDNEGFDQDFDVDTASIARINVSYDILRTNPNTAISRHIIAYVQDHWDDRIIHSDEDMPQITVPINLTLEEIENQISAL